MNFALITGASQGIGRAFAEAFAREGTNLILTARSASALEEVAANLRATYKITVQTYAVDLLEKDAVENLYEWCSSHKYFVKILVNNAGIGFYGNFEDIALEDYADMLYLNQNVLLVMCYTFLPMLKEIPNAHILNVSSITADIATPYLTAYSATKAFVLNFSRGLRQELLNTTVNVSCVCPGVTDTGFYDRAGFQKKKEDIKNMQMTAESVADIAVDGMYKKQALIIPGFTNKIGIFFSKLIPAGMLSELVSFVMKPGKKNKR